MNYSLAQDEETIERIKCRLEQYGDNLDQVEQICLDNIKINKFTTALRRNLQKYKNCQYLSMNYCQIVSLQNFPNFRHISALQLIGNQITGKQLIHLSNCPQIQMLALDQNKITKIQDFVCLNELKQIQHIQIKGNPVCSIVDYRSKIFSIAPKLKIIDCQDIFGDQNVMLGTETDQQNSDELQSQENQESSEEKNIQQNQQQEQFYGQRSRKF